MMAIGSSLSIFALGRKSRALRCKRKGEEHGIVER
jgi:hypothetical protein